MGQAVSAIVAFRSAKVADDGATFAERMATIWFFDLWGPQNNNFEMSINHENNSWMGLPDSVTIGVGGVAAASSGLRPSRFLKT